MGILQNGTGEPLRRNIIWMAMAGLVLVAGCATTDASSANRNRKHPPTSKVVVTVSPTAATVRAGAAQQFSASVTGATNTAVTWTVNGTAGGSSALGTINSAGLFVAAKTLPSGNAVTVAAVSAADSTEKASAAVTLLNPTPILNNISPAAVNAGSFTLTVTGSNFVSGAQVALGHAALITTFVSATELTATTTQSTAGTYAVTVINPNPGASTSAAVNLVVNAASSGGGGGTGGGGGGTTTSACSGMSVGVGASLNGFVPFPADNLWNQNIADRAVDPNSAAMINFIGGTIGMHADFGSGLYAGSSIGIPYAVVGTAQAPVNVTFNAYGDESDPGPMPIPANAQIEGAPNPGDQHVLVLDNANCWLYELYGASVNSNGSWNAASAAVWDLQNSNTRPWGWTSADAAGLPIFPGLARYDEVAAGEIKHALRFTLQHSKAAFVLPATHWASNSSNAAAAPMGARFRLKASFNMSGYSAANQVILKALQQYGMIMADNGSSMYLSGAPDSRWDNDDLHALGGVKASDFEVVALGTVYTQANLPQGQSPLITNFSASPAGAVHAGTAVTLSWTASGASYFVVSPAVGAVRGTSANVTPSATTAYTIYAANEFGQTTKTVTVTVQ